MSQVLLDIQYDCEILWIGSGHYCVNISYSQFFNYIPTSTWQQIQFFIDSITKNGQDFLDIHNNHRVAQPAEAVDSSSTLSKIKKIFTCCIKNGTCVKLKLENFINGEEKTTLTLIRTYGQTCYEPYLSITISILSKNVIQGEGRSSDFVGMA